MREESFDLVTCFEVLEHLPYDHFQIALEEIHRVCRRYALLSLPDARAAVRLRIPKIGPRQFLIELPFWAMPDHTFEGEHYWEINKKGYPLHRIVSAMEEAGFSVKKTWRLWEFPYHRFFRLLKAQGKRAER